MNQPTTVAPQPHPTVPNFGATPEDAALFERFLRSFVPPGSFDAHGHLYHLDHFGPAWANTPLVQRGPKNAGWSCYTDMTSQWMGDRTATGGLFFAFPAPDVDFDKANDFLAEQLKQNPLLRGQALIHPDHDPDRVEATIERHSFVGLKVYHVYAPRPDTFNAEIGEFLPEWAWELAHQGGLSITLHMVKPRALADPVNQQYIREHCLRYRDAKLILAHCARSFNAGHGLEGIGSLRGLDNVFFDNSAVCEPQAHEEILRVFGPTRLMFGLDYPVSEQRGRCVSIGDGFLWLDPDNVDWSGAAFTNHTIVGVENILALKHACEAMHLSDHDVEQVFFRTAHQLYDIGERPTDTGQALYREARQIIPGGTQLLSKRPEMFAPEQWPAYCREARGCEVVDMDGRHYIDLSYTGIGACLLGYADPDVTAAVMRRVQFGSMTTLNHWEEVELAKLLIKLHPWAQNVRFTRTGGESMAAAVRIARAATKREKVAICGYHGWHDWYLAANLGEGDALGDGHLLAGLDPNGVPRSLTGSTHAFHYNRIDELEKVIANTRGELACVVMEPIRYDPPRDNFLHKVRALCDEHGIKLIFDEITIGWKLAVGGAHMNYAVHPDIAVFAKSISNGFPMGAIIGNERTMQAAQTSFISSAYWTEGVGPAAALAAVTKYTQVDVIGHVDAVGRALQRTWRTLADKHHLPVETYGLSCMGGFKINHPHANALTTLFTVRMLAKGFLATASVHLCYAHQSWHVDRYAQAADEVFAELAEAIDKGDAAQRIGGPVKHTGFARLT